MDIGEVIGAIFNNSALTALLGVSIGALIENHRRNEDRRQRQIDRERDAISDLQFGLAEMLHGTWTASLAVERAELEVKMARIKGASPIEAVTDYPDLFANSWYQQWLAAIRKVGVMNVRTTDSELRRLVGNCLAAASTAQKATPEEFSAKYNELENATVLANERAGYLYQVLGEQPSVPWYRRWLLGADKPTATTQPNH